MKTKIAVAAAWLGLLMWAGPAVAVEADPIPLTVGHHRSIHLSDDKVDEILAAASKVLKKCNVVLKRRGHVRAFESSRTPSKIEDAADRDAVHRENFDIKVVDLPINFCRVSQMHEGCAFDPAPGEDAAQHKSMIVSDIANAKMAGMIWAHEFGHMRGLTHRSGDRKALMACRVPLQLDEPEISDHECKCFREGPASCGDTAEPAQLCSIN
ncbi:hypothetical protein [Rhodoplanes sp. Z2-YC6860]|uniref:hypothetical protein n=1 Tax=Rhodoplanes sp. Z2-YC6860 TaxID=674703 RepID=UPI0008338E73|nr:hypothetical protein [Rhodoplanes sp. Z2-YC6860]